MNLNSIFSGGKKYDVQDRIFVDDIGQSRQAWYRCEVNPYLLCNLSLAQTFRNRWRVTVGVDNLFNYRPKTLGSGITMFNVPATAGRRGFVQLEFLLK